MLSSEYGWTDEYIWKLTTRRVDQLISSIVRRRNLKMEFEALMHDKKLKLPKPKEDIKPLIIDKKQEDAIELAQKLAQQRVARRYGR